MPQSIRWTSLLFVAALSACAGDAPERFISELARSLKVSDNSIAAYEDLAARLRTEGSDDAIGLLPRIDPTRDPIPAGGVGPRTLAALGRPIHSRDLTAIARLTGLQPNQAYEYRILVDGTPVDAVLGPGDVESTPSRLHRGGESSFR